MWHGRGWCSRRGYLKLVAVDGSGAALEGGSDAHTTAAVLPAPAGCMVGTLLELTQLPMLKLHLSDLLAAPQLRRQPTTAGRPLTRLAAAKRMALLPQRRTTETQSP